MASAAKITVTLAPSEFDLLRAELAVAAERLHDTVKTPGVENARQRNEAREREARVRDLLKKLG